MPFDLTSLLNGIGGGLSGAGGGAAPGPNAGSGDAQDPSTLQKIMQILAAGTAGAGGGKRPGPVKSVFRKSNPNVRARSSLNATSAAPGFDATGASIPGLGANLPGPPASLGMVPGDNRPDFDPED